MNRETDGRSGYYTIMAASPIDSRKQTSKGTKLRDLLGSRLGEVSEISKLEQRIR